MEIQSKIRKWGNSYGILLSREVLDNENLHENDEVLVNVKSKKADLSGLFGICKFKRPTKEIIKEIKEGYNDF